MRQYVNLLIVSGVFSLMFAGIVVFLRPRISLRALCGATGFATATAVFVLLCAITYNYFGGVPLDAVLPRLLGCGILGALCAAGVYGVRYYQK